MRLYTASQMRRVDEIAIREIGIPSLRLMQNAGEAVARVLSREVPQLLKRVLVVCGKGNNGGDGMVVARLLRRQGYDPRVCLLYSPAALSGDALEQFNRLGPAGVRWGVASSPSDLPALRGLAENSGIILDAILGTGTQGALQGYLLEVVETLNSSGTPTVAIDVPSGLSGDSYTPIGPCVNAAMTITLAHGKPCLFTPECQPYCGDVHLVDIGIPEEASEGVAFEAEALDDEWASGRFLVRPPGSHKGDCGRVLLIAGGRGKSGAAALAGMGALRAGTGLLTIAVPQGIGRAVAGSVPEAMTLPLPETCGGLLGMDALQPLLDFSKNCDSVGIGPGLGTSPETASLVREIYGTIPLPMIADADALAAFESCPEKLSRHAGGRVLTPHPGEMARISGIPSSEVVKRRYGITPEKADEFGVTLLLKGYRSLVVQRGKPLRMNLSGGPHMAAPGMGDVLTGVVASLLARGTEPFDAASLACWWHGAAADLAFQRCGGYGLLASEVAGALPAVEGGTRAGTL